MITLYTNSMIMIWYIIVGATLGAIIGSFIAVAIIRLPENENVISGRSRCDNCKETIPPYLIIPIISYILLRGKCNRCKTYIDSIHIKMEIMAALLSASIFAFIPWQEAIIWCLLIWQLLLLAMLDLRYYWLPDKLNLLLAISGLIAVSFIPDAPNISDRLMGGVIGFLILYSTASIYRRMRRHEGLGGGDPKMLGSIGCWFGWQALPHILLLAAVMGLCIALLMQIMGHNVQSNTRLPLGILLAISAFLMLHWNYGVFAITH